MSDIRRQSIISSFVVYFGFALGFLNTYLFTKEGGFTQEEYGLTGIFIAIANVMYAVANLGMQTYIYKFYPYYRDNLPAEKSDLMGLVFLTSFIGFAIMLSAAIIFRDFVIQKYGTNSPKLITYYYWLFPFGFGLTLYSLLEAFAWQFRKTILTNYLREVQFRLFTTVLIILSFINIIPSFDLFIKLFSFTYLAIALILCVYLFRKKYLYINFSISKVTKKFRKKIMTLAGFTWGGGVILTIANMFDSLVIAAVLPQGLALTGVYTLAQNVASLMQAPQRGIISASVAPLSQAWKDKDFHKIKRIYHSSSINQLIFSTGMFVLIWINFSDGVFTFGLQKGYLDARNVFLFIGLMRIIDMGTGVNAQIIGTSTRWRFEFFSGIILLALALPLNYILTKNLGVIGPAVSNLIAFFVYNVVRYSFLLKEYGMQPFNLKSVYTIVLALAGYFICHYLFGNMQGFWWIVVRSLVFCIIFFSGVLLLRISPDILPVLTTVKNRLKKN
jgi:O-antigen/teichoic acid export membrane protein